MEKIILHFDFNSYFASCEESRNPALKKVPMVVGGDEEMRHGIVLAKNILAKQFGIQTGESLMEARAKCRELTVVPADYYFYAEITKKSRDIFIDYTPYMEPGGSDEAYLDVSLPSGSVAVDGKKIADELRERSIRELNLTASVGVSDNRAWAKLGSDLRKPNYTNVITRENYKDVVWPLPVEDLLYVGPRTKPKLNGLGIYTIGDLAKSSPEFLQYRMKPWHSRVIWSFANGIDPTPVRAYTEVVPAKSISNSRTMPHDLLNRNHVKAGLWPLCESIASRLYKINAKGNIVSMYARNNQFNHMTWGISRQMKLNEHTWLAKVIFDNALSLFDAYYRWDYPVRALGVHVGGLIPIDSPQQLSLYEYEEVAAMKRLARLEAAVFNIRQRYGYYAIQKCMMLADQSLMVDAEREHINTPMMANIAIR